MKQKYESWLKQTILPAIIVVALLILLLLLFLFATGYQRSLINLYLLYIILAISFDILFGNTGYVNLSHASASILRVLRNYSGSRYDISSNSEITVGASPEDDAGERGKG